MQLLRIGDHGGFILWSPYTGLQTNQLMYTWNGGQTFGSYVLL